MKIAEKNKLIAKFMGYKYYHPGVDVDTSECGGCYERFEVFSKIPIETDEYPEDDQFYIKDTWYMKVWDEGGYFHEAKYHESWDCLMPVVEKLQNTEEILWIEQEDLCNTFQYVNINATYEKVFTLVKIYNEQIEKR